MDTTPQFDNFIKSGLASENGSLRYMTSLISLFLEQFFKVYAPAVYKGVCVTFLLFSPQNRNEMNSILPGDVHIPLKTTSIKREYRSFVDDRKASMGSFNEVAQLRDLGYDKFRYLSKSFIERSRIALLEENQKSKYHRKSTSNRKKKQFKKTLHISTEEDEDANSILSDGSEISSIISRAKRKRSKRNQDLATSRE